MSRLIRQIVTEGQDIISILNTTIDNNHLDFNTTTPFIILFDNNTNSTVSAFSSSSNEQGFSWELSWNLVILLGLSLIFATVIISIGIWYWYNRTNRLRRQYSSPIAVSDFIETTKIRTSPIIDLSTKPPPVPPRPTAYTTILGKVEYRSNL